MLVFVGEMCLNIFVRGLYKGPQAYLASRWRMLDCAIVVFSAAAEISGGSQVRVLRALRALRALRLVSRFPQLQMVVQVRNQSMLNRWRIMRCEPERTSCFAGFG
jgi:hypothetical protein